MASPSLLSHLASRALDLLYPPRCLGCGAFGHYLCGPCLAATPRASPPRCPLCWMPTAAGDPCPPCRERPPAFVAARCPFLHEGTARQAVHALKYRGLSAVAPAMAALMADCLADGVARDNPFQADLIVPVPLHARRQRQRGYNQSALLARELSSRLGLAVEARALVRRRPTPPQAGSADRETRYANVADAFAADPALVQGRRVLLVDDVMTTGATLDACARALRETGAAAVSALAFARED